MSKHLYIEADAIVWRRVIAVQRGEKVTVEGFASIGLHHLAVLHFDRERRLRVQITYDEAIKIWREAVGIDEALKQAVIPDGSTQPAITIREERGWYPKLNPHCKFCDLELVGDAWANASSMGNGYICQACTNFLQRDGRAARQREIVAWLRQLGAVYEMGDGKDWLDAADALEKEPANG